VHQKVLQLRRAFNFKLFIHYLSKGRSLLLLLLAALASSIKDALSFYFAKN
jgi:hypothetical protein